MNFENINSNQSDMYLLRKHKLSLLEECFKYFKKKEIEAYDPKTMSGFSDEFSYFPNSYFIFTRPVVIKKTFSKVTEKKKEEIITPDESSYTGEGTGHNTKAKIEDEYERMIKLRNDDDCNFKKMFEKSKKPILSKI
jgi:hypothetical protein